MHYGLRLLGKISDFISENGSINLSIQSNEEYCCKDDLLTNITSCQNDSPSVIDNRVRDNFDTQELSKRFLC